jgi:antitoxin component of RelBE/YafQ-DinJ toxin-antitoxin module
MKTLIVKDIDEKVKNEFKAACAKNGRTMAAVLIELMMRYVETEV